MLHLGAGSLTSLPSYTACKVKSVHWVEARPTEVREMRKACPSQCSRIIEACLSDESLEVVKFTETRDGSRSSMLPIIDPTTKIIGHRFLRTITLADMLRVNKIDPCMFTVMVVELQGMEFRVLRTVPEAMWSVLQLVCIRMSENSQMYQGGAMPKDIIDVMDMLGFSLLCNEVVDSDKCFSIGVFVKQ